jgi:TPR repeat protein
LGLVTDEEEALKWHRKAADGGHAGAQCRLAIDLQVALMWFKKAAEGGDNDAQTPTR